MEAQIHIQVLVAAFVLAALMGAATVKTNFCTMGGVSDWINMEDTSRLRAWLLAGAVAILGTVLLEAFAAADLSSTFPPFRMAKFNWIRYLLGGALFGIGMTLGSGCGNKTLVRVGGGNMKSVVVMLLIGITAYWMLWTEFFEIAFNSWLDPLAIDLTKIGAAGQGIDQLLAAALGVPYTRSLHVGVGIALAIGLGGWTLASAEFRANRNAWVSGVIFGVIVAAGWWITAGPWGTQWKEWAEMADAPPLRVNAQSYVFTAALGDAARWVLRPTDFSLLSFGLAASAGVIAGSFVQSAISRELRLEWFANFADFRNHVAGGVLMGIGGVLAMGCSIGQGVTGLSTLALGSVLTLAAIIAGSAITMKLQYRFA